MITKDSYNLLYKELLVECNNTNNQSYRIFPAIHNTLLCESLLKCYNDWENIFH